MMPGYISRLRDSLANSVVTEKSLPLLIGLCQQASESMGNMEDLVKSWILQVIGLEIFGIVRAWQLRQQLDEHGSADPILNRQWHRCGKLLR
jgi:hypothetical protein